MYQRGPQYGVTAAAASAPPLARGRGRASVLPAWMTNPDLAREAQSTPAVESSGKTTVSSASVTTATAGESASLLSSSSSSSASVITSSVTIAVKGFNASSKPNHDNQWRPAASASRFDQPPTAMESAATSGSRGSGARREGSSAGSARRRPNSRASSEMSTSHSRSRSSSRSRGNGLRRTSQTKDQRAVSTSPTAESSARRVLAERGRRRHVSRSPSPSSSKGSPRGGARDPSAPNVVASTVSKCRSDGGADSERHATGVDEAGSAVSPSREKRARSSADDIVPRHKDDASKSPSRRRSSPRGGSPVSTESRGRPAAHPHAGARASPSNRNAGPVERAYPRRRPRSGSPESAGSRSRSGGARRRRRRYAEDVYDRRDGGSERRESSPLYKSCKAICSSLNGIRNEASFSRKRSLIEQFLRNVDVEEFVFEDASGTRRSWRSFERRVLLDEEALKDTVEVTRRVWVSKDEATSYCLEMEWTSVDVRDRNSHHTHRSRRHPGPAPEEGQGTVALYEARKGRLTRCFFFQDPGHLCSPHVGKVDFEKDIRSCRLWAIVVKYLLKKGVSSSALCSYWDSVADRRPASGREERRYVLVSTASPHKH